MDLVRERTLPIERPPLVGEVSANFSGQIVLVIVIHEVVWTPLETHYFSENLVVPGTEPGHLAL
jgi:hypothetical protein